MLVYLWKTSYSVEKLIFINMKIARRASLAGAQLLTSVSRKRRSALFFLMFLRRTDTATVRTKITTMKRTPITPAAIRGVLEKQKKRGGGEKEQLYSKSEGESLKISKNTQSSIEMGAVSVVTHFWFLKFSDRTCTC